MGSFQLEGGTEGAFLEALKNASRLTITDNRLELSNAAGTRVAAFVARSQPNRPSRLQSLT